MSSAQYLSLHTIEHIKKLKNNNYYNAGIYYQFIITDYKLMKKYYNLAIKNKQNIPDIYNNLGYYYIDIEKKYDLGKDYYLKAIDLDNMHSMNNFG